MQSVDIEGISAMSDEPEDGETSDEDPMLAALHRINGNLYDIRRTAHWILGALLIIAVGLGLWISGAAEIAPDVTLDLP